MPPQLFSEAMICYRSWKENLLDVRNVEYSNERIGRLSVGMHRKMTTICSATDILQQHMIPLKTRSISWIDEDRVISKFICKRRLISTHARSKKILFDGAKIDSHKMSAFREGSPD